MFAKAIKMLRNYGLSYCPRGAYQRGLRIPITGLDAYVDCVAGLHGLEVGGPSPVFQTHALIPLYDKVGSLDNCNFTSETVWEGKLAAGQNFRYSKNKPPGMQYVSEGADLTEIPDQHYDFMLSSHMLEHTANPLRALKAWRRCLKADGSLILLLPDKDWTFDHKRPVTTLEHLIHDFEAGTTEDDLTHLAEIMTLHDLDRDPAAGDYASFKARSEKNAENRCLHQHVFDAALVRQALERSGFSVKSIRKNWPHHIITIARKS